MGQYDCEFCDHFEQSSFNPDAGFCNAKRCLMPTHAKEPCNTNLGREAYLCFDPPEKPMNWDLVGLIATCLFAFTLGIFLGSKL